MSEETTKVVQRVHKFVALNLMEDGTTCLDIEVDIDGQRQMLHIPGGPLTVERVEQPKIETDKQGE